jgi:hypothetical protein
MWVPRPGESTQLDLRWMVRCHRQPSSDHRQHEPLPDGSRSCSFCMSFSRPLAVERSHRYPSDQMPLDRHRDERLGQYLAPLVVHAVDSFGQLTPTPSRRRVQRYPALSRGRASFARRYKGASRCR